MIDINIVKERFSQSRNTYKQEAKVQREIADRLAEEISKIGESSHDRILEIGCGTGFLTDNILSFIKPSHYFINDLSDLMQSDIDSIARKHRFQDYTFIPGDAEELSFAGNLDMVISASTFQWFNDLKRFLNKISGLLNEGGYIVFSTFGKHNFNEIRTTLGIGLDYMPVGEIVDKLTGNYSVIESFEWERKQYFTSPIEVLKHIKLTGVNSVVNSFIGKSKLKLFCEEYINKFSDSSGNVSLTYNPIIVIAQKLSTKR